MARLRDIINANVTNPANYRWVTLTYQRNMTDHKTVYEDFRRFWLRFQYYLKKHHLAKAEYIAVIEPQARGAWHLHIIFVFPHRAPFIPNHTLSSIWKHGFTKISKLENIDNVGLYLTAYLDSVPVEDIFQHSSIKGELKTVKLMDENGKSTYKSVIKGGRLSYYPKHIRLFRTSRGIQHPTVLFCTEQEAQELVGTAPLTYEKTVRIQKEDGSDVNIINYRQYNKARKTNIRNTEESI